MSINGHVVPPNFFKLAYATFPMSESVHLANQRQGSPRDWYLGVPKLDFEHWDFWNVPKLCHVTTPWRSGLGSNFGWFSETSNQALSRLGGAFWSYSPPSCPNLGFKKCRFGQKSLFFPVDTGVNCDVIGRFQFFKPSLRHNLDQYQQYLGSNSAVSILV